MKGVKIHGADIYQTSRPIKRHDGLIQLRAWIHIDGEAPVRIESKDFLDIPSNRAKLEKCCQALGKLSCRE